MLELVEVFRMLGKEKDEVICEFKVEVDRLFFVYVENSGELF